MNLLSIGAALGVMTAAFQWGWGKPLLGFTRAGPIEVFLPVLMFAILFGLSMDYEVFLVSRMHEEWVRTGDSQRSVTVGQAETGRVITAAALIMILVFLSFILGGQIVIKEVGLGFAAAIFVDAFVIRTVLVPSLMHVLGPSNWWLPKWLDRILPHAPRRAGGHRRGRPGAGAGRSRPQLTPRGAGAVARTAFDQTGRMPPPLAPWPFIVNGRRIVAPDVDGIDARLRFDVSARQATGEALVRFTAGDETGHPALDLRQPVEWLRLDGESLAPEAFAHLDVGAGPGSEVRVLDVTLEAGSRHQLEVGYPLETPAATGAEPITWNDGGVRFDLWMSRPAPRPLPGDVGARPAHP